jgi:hypothetical protein
VTMRKFAYLMTWAAEFREFGSGFVIENMDLLPAAIGDLHKLLCRITREG